MFHYPVKAGAEHGQRSPLQGGRSLPIGLTMSYSSFSRSNPCPICGSKGKKQRCSGRLDGSRVYCPEAGEYDLVPGWFCTGWRTDDGRNALIWEPEGAAQSSLGRAAKLFTGAGPTPRPRPSKKTQTGREVLEGIQPRSQFERISDDVEITMLADPCPLFVNELGLLPEAAKAMDWRPWKDQDGRRCWVVPEWTLVDGVIRQAGWNLRYPGGAKLTHGNDDLPDGHRRGLFRPTDWQKGPDGSPVFLPEGASGSTTLKMLGLRCLGRHNNGWGDVETIAHLMRDAGLVEAGVPLVVLADDDADHTRFDPVNPSLFHFPGRWGARRAAAALARELGVSVRVAFVPRCKRLDGKPGKDARDWFHDNRDTGTIDQLRERFLAGLQWDVTVHPEDYDAVWALPCYRPDRKPVAPVPCVGGDGASEAPSKTSSDLSDLEQFDWEAATAELAARCRVERYEVAGSPDRCSSPTYVGLSHCQTWDAMEVTKRCGKCPGCLTHKLKLALDIVRHTLRCALSVGCHVYTCQLTPKEWQAWRQRYHTADSFAGKGYFCFRVEGVDDEPDQLTVLTTVPCLGEPVCPGPNASSREEIEAAAALAGPLMEMALAQGGRPFSSARHWAKARLTRREEATDWGFKAKLEPITEEFRDRILEDVEARCDIIEPSAGSGSDSIVFRIYKRIAGWTRKLADRFWSLREGYLLPGGEEPTFSLGKSEPDTLKPVTLAPWNCDDGDCDGPPDTPW